MHLVDAETDCEHHHHNAVREYSHPTLPCLSSLPCPACACVCSCTRTSAQTDKAAKSSEFTRWAMDVKKVNLETCGPTDERDLFKMFMEDYNTGGWLKAPRRDAVAVCAQVGVVCLMVGTVSDVCRPHADRAVDPPGMHVRRRGHGGAD